MAENKNLEIRLEAGGLPESRLYRLTGRETISQLFDFEVEIALQHGDGPDPTTLVGEEVAIVFEVGGVEARRVCGMIGEAHDLLARLKDFRTYRLRIVPRAFRLTLIESQETFANVTVPDLIKLKLEQVGLGDSEMRLMGTYPERDLVVQYKETDYAFICRLAEHAGICFFFEHGEQDKMVFTDMASGFQPSANAATIKFSKGFHQRDVFELEARAAAVPSMFVVRDYNYRTPMVDVTGEHPLPVGYGGGVIEFGPHVRTPAEATTLAQVRAEERQSRQFTYGGKSGVPGIATGAESTVEEHPQISPQLVFIDILHEATQPLHGDKENVYVNTFVAIPSGQTYRPPRVTPKPRVTGLLTGIIEAGGGSATDAEIDEQGRYMVRFLFDTGSGQSISRPVRMLQNHVGANYGTHFPLKPGIEVLIGFVNGDPDRPLIVGAAPNPITASPVDAKNRSTHRIKTQSGIRIDMVDK